jgi:hypothetical protein
LQRLLRHGELTPPGAADPEWWIVVSVAELIVDEKAAWCEGELSITSAERNHPRFRCKMTRCAVGIYHSREQA